jgi:hypothetical protein
MSIFLLCSLSCGFPSNFERHFLVTFPYSNNGGALGFATALLDQPCRQPRQSQEYWFDKHLQSSSFQTLFLYFLFWKS